MFFRKSFFSRSTSPKNKTKKSGSRRSWLGRRHAMTLEPLEERRLLAIDFIASPLAAPLTNRVDVGLGTMGGFAPIEPTVVINPTDPGNIAVSSHIGGQISTTVGTTFTGTFTFTNPAGTTATSGDTDMIFDSQGRLFWANLAGIGAGGVSVNQRNPTTGAFIPGSSINVRSGNDDKEFITADQNPNSPWRDNLYMVWTGDFGPSPGPTQIYFSRSVDNGLTWSAPLQLSNNAAEGFPWPSDVGVAPNGDVYVAYHAGGQTGAVGDTWVLRSTDGGQTFPQKNQAFLPGESDITFNVQTAPGAIPGTQFWMQGAAQPWVLADQTRPGQIYIINSDDPDNAHGNAADDVDIVISRSADNGLTWSRSTVPGGAGSHQFFPTAATDEFGNIVLAWYDNRNGATNGAGRFLLDVFATYSTDGGITWAAPFQVNDAGNAFDPDIGAVNRFAGPPPTTRIGEYFGIDIFGGTAHVAWNGPTPVGGGQTGHQVVYGSFAIGGQVIVTGDDSGAPTDDDFLIQRSAADPAFIEVFVNGQRQYAGLIEGLQQIDVLGLGGNDTLTVDSTNGLVNLPNGIRFDGGTGFDRLDLTQTGGPTRTSSRVNVGALPGSGQSIIDTQVVDFQNLEPVVDNVPAATFTLSSVPGIASLLDASNAINYTDAQILATAGRITVDNFEPIEFDNKTNLVIDAHAGDDTINLNNPNTPTGLTSITVDGGDPTASDTVIVNGAAGANAVNFAPTGANSGTITGLGPVINITTAEHVTYNGQGGNDDLTVTSPGGGDIIEYTPGGVNTFDTGLVTMVSFVGTSRLPIDFLGLGFPGGSLTFANSGGGAVDSLFVNGTAQDDVFTVTPAGVLSIREDSPFLFLVSVDVNTPGVSFLTLRGHDGDDTFAVPGNHPYAFGVVIEAGNPSASDVLNFTGTGGAITVDLATPSVTEAGFAPVSLSGVEVVNVDAGGGIVTVNGTSGNDRITVAPENTGNPTVVTLAGLNTVFNFEGSNGAAGGFVVNGAPGEDELTVVGKANSDSFTIDLTIPRVTRAGLIPIDLTSFVQLNVLGLTGDDTFNVTPGSIPLKIDGGDPIGVVGDRLALTVPAAAGATTFTAGPESDEGGFDFAGLASVSYDHIEAVAPINVVAAGGVVNIVATNADNDINILGVDADSVTVSIDGGPAIQYDGVTVLNVDALAGDDDVDLTVGPLTILAINITGNDPTASDTLLVNGTAGADVVIIAVLSADSATVTGLATPINVATTEHLIYNGQGGFDDVTVTTPAGNDLVDYRPAAQIDAGNVLVTALGVSLLPFSFENIGSTLSSLSFADTSGLRTDRLTFHGTAADDVFSVNAAGGITLNRIPSATLLPVLTPGISRVVLLGLEGDDIFNIPGNHLFTGGIFVQGGDPSASDVLNFTGSGAGAVTVDFGAATVQEAGFAAVSFAGVEILNANAGGANLSILTTNGDDNLTVTPTTDGGITARLTTSPAIGTPPVVNASNIATFLVSVLAGSDTLGLVYSEFAETITITPAAVSRPGLETVNYTGVVNLRVFGQAGDDTFDVTPSAATTIFIDGGDPIGETFPFGGDTLSVVGAVLFFPGPEVDEGGFVAIGAQTVSFDHIENFGPIIGVPCVIILGTNGDDDITVIARDASYNALADGVQDFTVSVNGGPDILYIDVPELYIDALAGDDDIVLRTPAPNLAVWDVDVFIAGGSPAAPTGDQGDVFELETPGTQTLNFTPTGSDSGVIDVITLSTVITLGTFVDACPPINYDSSLGGVETIVYDGVSSAGLDDLTINGSFNDTTNYDAASFLGTFRSILSPDLDFSLVGRLTVNAGVGNFDVVNIVGSAGDDIVTSTANAITIDTPGTLGIVTIGAGVDLVTLSTLAGNDTVDLDLNVVGLRKSVDVGAGNDTVDMSGTIDADIFGGLGNDVLIGSPAADNIFGGPGDDVLVGGAGNDYQYGEEGNDIIGNPTIFVDGVANDAGIDFNFGGPGFDNFVWEPGDGADFNNGGEDAADIFRFFGGAGVDAFTLRQGGTPTHFNALIGALVIDNHGIEDVIVDGRGGADTFTVNDLFATEVVSINLNLSPADGGAVDPVTVNGRNVADNLLLSTSAAGAVSIQGLRYNVNLTNAEATDTLAVNGNEGDDLLTAAAGTSSVIALTLSGGGGHDFLDASATTVTGVTLEGDAGDDTLLGGAGNDTLRGEAVAPFGNDTFIGNGGTDAVGAGAGLIGDRIVVPGTPGNDGIILAMNAVGHLLVTINGLTTTYTNFVGGPIAGSGVDQIAIVGGAGDDFVSIDSTNGGVPIAIEYDGGSGSDFLQLFGGVATDNIYSVGPNPGQGTSAIFLDVLQVVTFQNIEPVFDRVAGPITVNATPADNAINFAGLVISVDNFEAISIANKTDVTINAGAGSDTININGPTGFAGALNLDGGDPTASDTVIITGTVGLDTVNFAPTAFDAGTFTGLVPVINITTAEHVIYNGQGGFDSLAVSSPVGGSEISFTPGATSDAGSITHEGFVAGTSLLPLDYTTLGTLGSLTFDVVGGGRSSGLDIHGTNSDDQFDVAAVTGTVQVVKPAFLLPVTVPINTTGIVFLRLIGENGDDIFNIPGDHPIPVGIEVQGGDPSASDVLNFTAVAAPVAPVNVNLATSTVTQAGFGPVAFSGVEVLNVDASAQALSVTGTDDDDDLTVTVLTATSGQIEIGYAVQQNGQVDQVGLPVINYSGLTPFPLNSIDFDLGAGQDTLVVVGNAFAQNWLIDAAAGTVQIDDVPVPADGTANDGFITFTNTESLAAFGLEGNDAFTVIAGPIPVFVDGGDPIGTGLPGDSILVIGAFAFFPGPEPDEGGFLTGPGGTVSFDHIESAAVVGVPGCPFLILGTNADDDITVIARDSVSTPQYPGADGIQDFTVSVNAGPDILFIDQPDLFIDALSGDDDIVVRTPAPNDVPWDVNVRIAGGPPSAVTGDQGDVVEVETPGFDNIVYTPTGSDTGFLVVDENNNGIYDAAAVDSIITIGPFVFFCPDPPPGFTYNSSPGGAEELVYDGEGFDDNFTIVGTVFSDLIIHTPGAGRDEGAIRVNELLGISYQNIGRGATLTIDGGSGGFDQLHVQGTSSRDVLTVEAGSGRILQRDGGLFGIDNRVPITSANIEDLVLNGRDGDDSFIINDPQPYARIAVNGGGPGNSDDLQINGQFGVSDIFLVAPGSLAGNGAVFASSSNFYTGIEHIFLTGNVGEDDRLTINDDFRDNIWEVSAGTIGDLVQIDDRESIDYNNFNRVVLANFSGTDLFRVAPTNLTGFTTSFDVVGDGVPPLDDVLEIIGTPGDDIVTSTGEVVTVNGVGITAGAGGFGLIELRVLTLGGADNIDLDLALGFTRKVVHAGAENDIINMAGTLDATIIGGLGDDNIVGTPLDDLIYGDDPALTGGGNDTINAGGGNDFVYGGAGNDILMGNGGNDHVYGDDGNDILGNPSDVANGIADDAGDDFFFGGAGSDRFFWEPGDGSDTMEGGAGEADILRFFGSAGVETFNIFADLADPSRAVLFRSLAAIRISMAGIDEIDVQGNDGADRYVIGRVNDGDLGDDVAPTSPYTDPTATLSDLSTTEVRVVNVNLATILAAAADLVFVDGRPLDDNLLVSVESAATGVIRVAGLPYDVRILNSAVAQGDTLTVRGNEGNDTIKSVNPTGGGALSVESIIGITLAGGGDDDFLSADAILIGGIGDDFLEGGAGADLIFGNQGEDTMVGGGGLDTFDGGPDFDTVLFRGTSGNDVMSANQTAATTVVTTLNGLVDTDTLVLLAGVRTVERYKLEALAGNDVILVQHLDALGVDALVNSVLFDVDGGEAQTQDRLSVQDNGIGDLLLYRKAAVDTAGSISVGPGNAESLENVFANVEFIQPIAAAGGQVLVFKHDPNEFNDERILATHLGAGDTINLDPTIDPGPFTPVPGGFQPLPGDQDWYRFEAEFTGTLDFQVFFEEFPTVPSGRPGLPANGNLDIFVYDVDGTFIAGNGTGADVDGNASFSGVNFGDNDGGNGGTGELNVDGEPNQENERIRIPVVQGQIYYLRVIGAGVASLAVNNYSMTVINVPALVPYDLELDDNLGFGDAIAGGTTTVFTSTPRPGTSGLSPINGYYVGKEITFTTGALDGQTAVVTAYTFAAGIGTFTVTPAFSAAPGAGDDFQVDAVDTGRSQFDNVTRDNTPTIFVRLDDNFFLNDLPGIFVTDTPPDEIIPIPFQGGQGGGAFVFAVPSYSIALFDEGPGTVGSSLPQNPIAFAFNVGDINSNGVIDGGEVFLPGNYKFNSPILLDGSHFLSARAQIIDPANPFAFAFGARSVSLEIIVDTVVPPVSFGDPVIIGDGLSPVDDSGVSPPNPDLLVDRVTNDTTPTFWGRAEADAIIRLYVDINGNQLFDQNIDRFIGQATAIPLDGSNQEPHGYWEIESIVSFNDPAIFPLDGLRTIFVVAEDLAGNINLPDDLLQERLRIFIDTQGPRITSVFITDVPAYDLFNPKGPDANGQGPTPLAKQLTITFTDPPIRVNLNDPNLPIDFIFPALKAETVITDHFQVIGDQNGRIAIVHPLGLVQTLVPVPGMPGFFTATATVTLTFFTPLPDDRFTLIVTDSVFDPAGNRLDGETNAAEPQENPRFPSGDGVPGGDFVARFTIDSRPELAAYAGIRVYADINGNFLFDPEGEDNDAVNRDIVFRFGSTSDALFAGKFVTPANVNAGAGVQVPAPIVPNRFFDQFAAYGNILGSFRWLFDFDSNGVADLLTTQPAGFQINGIPVAGNFDGVPGNNGFANGDEIGLFDGLKWWRDTNHDFVINGLDAAPINGLSAGFPQVGDVDGDGLDDFITYQGDTYFVDFANNGLGVGPVISIPLTLDGGGLGFPGVSERPTVADMNQDGIDDFGVWVPGNLGQTPSEISEWFFLVSEYPLDPNDPLITHVPGQPVPGVQAGSLWSFQVFPLVNGSPRRHFEPVPFGTSLFAVFGDEPAFPIVGNFDPPIEAGSGFGGTSGSLDTNNVLVVSSGPGAEPRVHVYNRQTGDLVLDIMAYNPAFRGGVQVATADVNGDGVVDIITAPGPGGGPHIRVFDGTNGAVIREFFAYNAAFTGGVNIAAGDINNDGRADLVTGPGAGGGPHVRIFSGSDNTVLGEYFAYNAAFTGGVNVAIGDINGDGTLDVITGAGAGGGPHVRVFSGATSNEIQGYFAYNAAFGGGVYVAAGDVDGDGHDDVITGAGAGGGPHVRVFSGANGAELKGFFAYDAAFGGGVRVGTGDFDGDGRADIITGPGAGGGPHVRAFDGDNLNEVASFFAFPGNFTGGVFVAAPGAGGGQALRAASQGGGAAALSQSQLDMIVAAAIGQWDAAVPGSARKLRGINVQAADLPGTHLGLAYQDLIVIDSDAAGHGWFVDSTPDTSDDLDAGSMDLLSAVAHELGHVLGLDDLDDDSLMDGQLSVGVRHAIEAVDAVFAGID